MITLTMDNEHAYAIEEALRQFLETPIGFDPSNSAKERREKNLVREVFNNLESELTING